MKAEVTDVSETRKTLTVEIPSGEVDAEIDRVTRDYARSVRVHGFRPGKVPPTIVRQRYRDRILHEVAHELVPRAIDEALRDRGLEPLDRPEVKDMALVEGQPLTFTAAFETAPVVEPGDYATITIRRNAVTVTDDAVEGSLQQLREQAARFEPAGERGVEQGDVLTVDLTRTRLTPPAEGSTPAPESHTDATLEVGAEANPPGFDDQIMGQRVGETRTFQLTLPPDEESGETESATIEYRISVKTIRVKVLPALDDELAKDLGDFASLDALRARVRDDLERQAERTERQQVRQELLQQLARWVTSEVPSVLVDREIDRRVEEFARHLIEQRIDPRKANIDWDGFRESQREPALDAVRSLLMLDAIAQREGIRVEPADLDTELQRIADRTGRNVAAVRARLEKDGALSRLVTGLRRERTFDLVLSRVTMVTL